MRDRLEIKKLSSFFEKVPFYQIVNTTIKEHSVYCQSIVFNVTLNQPKDRMAIERFVMFEFLNRRLSEYNRVLTPMVSGRYDVPVLVQVRDLKSSKEEKKE
jgi:hypothetical protein